MKGIIYVQVSGEIALQNGDFELPFAVGFAGRGEGRNNPAHDHIPNEGPPPRGRYKLRVVDHPRFTAPAIRLYWEQGQKVPRHGRSGFYIHGGTKSEGCIILQHTERQFIAAAINAGFSTLTVV